MTRVPHRRCLVGIVAALGVAASLGGAGAPAVQAATATKTVPYVDPPAPTPPDPVPVRPAGRLVPSEGALFGIHTVPDSPTAKSAADMGITKREADAGRTMDIDNHYYASFDDAAPLSGGKPTLPGWRETWDVQNGRIPLITRGGPDVNEIVAAKYDTAIDGADTRLQALGEPFFLQRFCEQEWPRHSKDRLSNAT